MVLALSGPEPGELTPAELEMLSRSLMGTLSKLARERDLGAQVGAAGASWTQAGELEDHQGAGCAREMEVWGPGMGLWSEVLGHRGCHNQMAQDPRPQPHVWCCGWGSMCRGIG